MATDESLIRTILLVIAVILLLPVLLMAVMVPMMGIWGWGHMWDGGVWNDTGATWMWLLMSAVPILVILGVGYLLYRLLRHPSMHRRDEALEELRIAYARGDISDEEYEKRREHLQREK